MFAGQSDPRARATSSRTGRALTPPSGSSPSSRPGAARRPALQLDVGDSRGYPAFVDAVTSELHRRWQRTRLDYLVNNAGIGLGASIAETTEERHAAVNLQRNGRRGSKPTSGLAQNIG